MTSSIVLTRTETHLGAFDLASVYQSLRSVFPDDSAVLFETTVAMEGSDTPYSAVAIGPVLNLRIRSSVVQFSGLEALCRLAVDACRAAGFATQANEATLGAPSELWALLRTVRDLFVLPQNESTELPGFGFVGCLNYDIAGYTETLPQTLERSVSIPDATLSVHSGLVLQNTMTRDCTYVGYAAAELFEPLAPADMQAALSAMAAEADEVPPVPSPSAVTTTMQREHYIQNVEKAREYIGIGDIYQVVLGHGVKVRSAAEPIDVYRRMRSRNPSPFMFLAEMDDVTVVGASPELFVQLNDGHVLIEPIAGTTRRGANPDEDARIVATLLKDEKELAEHVMLVDLARNDIARVCRPESLQVKRLMKAVQYSHVNHIASEVVGDVRPSFDEYDVLAAAFPAGTMTGAPKIRAMEIIEELENSQRGFYSGAIGMIGFNGRVNTALCIRTAFMVEGEYNLRASAGVVADSRPEREWDETWEKLAAPYWAITGEEVVDASSRH